MANILVVDDNASILLLVSDFFGELKGHTVHTAENAADAMQIVRDHPLDLALLDIMMPGVHGIDLLREIKRIKPDLKAVMITAVDDEEVATEAMEVGAADYVTKPLDLNYLDAVVTFQLMS